MEKCLGSEDLKMHRQGTDHSPAPYLGNLWGRFQVFLKGNLGERLGD